MSYKKMTVNRSSIEGYGLYAGEDIKQGEIIMFWMADAYLIPEEEYNQRQMNGDTQMIDTGVRYVGNMFLYTDSGPQKDRYENYINHSFTPNVLYHCGVCFALKDITAGDELTTDYTYLLSEFDQGFFEDKASGKTVKGINWVDCLRETSEQLTRLMTKKIKQTPSNLTVYIPSNSAD